MSQFNRWTILEHTGAPDDPVGIHFDLLLEDGPGCRTWRLAYIPLLDGNPIEAISISVHDLEWLDRHSGEVSGGRGWAKSVMSGYFSGVLPKNVNEPVQIDLYKSQMEGRLEIHHGICHLRSFDSFDS